MLANQGGLEPFFDQPLARPRDRVDTGLQRRRDLAVAPALTTVRGVGFQQDPGLQQLLCWMVSAMDQGGEMLSLLIAQCHYVFLYRDLFPGHQSAPSAATEPSNQTNTAESMTGATSSDFRSRDTGAYRCELRHRSTRHIRMIFLGRFGFFCLDYDVDRFEDRVCLQKIGFQQCQDETLA